METIVNIISEVASTIVFLHIGYLFQYKGNFHNLEVETERLEDLLRRIDYKVETAKNNVEIIDSDVEKWQKDAKGMKDEIDAFLENKVRLNSWSLMWCYWLGKESKLKTSRVISLKEQGTKFSESPVARPAPPREHHPTIYEVFESRHEILNGIMEALKDPTIEMIGVHGEGGVGKTTMVKEVGNLAKKSGLFGDVAFAVVSRNLDKKYVQGELAAQLGLHLDDYGRQDKLRTRLQNGKKNLVTLDDVWDPLNLEEIGIPTTTDHDDDDGCCKVLVTSRKQLLHMMTSKPVDQRALGVSIGAPVASTKDFRIPLLEKKEAQTLFMKTAEISVNSNEETLSVAKEVCDECGGLPVAILAVATALKGKEPYAWQDALALLKNSNFDQIVDIEPNLFSSLKLSYDHLEPREARSCFLLCSLFPEDAEISIEDLVSYSFGMRLIDSILCTTLEGVRNRVLTLVKGLKASCLLLEGRDDNTVKMHDVIRDVAILIAKGEKRYLVEHDLKKWPEGATFEGNLAISLKSEYFCDIPSELGSPKLHTLVLRSKDSSLPDSFFKGMDTNLEVLDLSGMAIDSVPFSLSKLVKLRMLHLPDQVRDISLLGELRSLEILRVNGIEKLAPEIRQLNRLKLLDLGNNNNLGVIAPNVLSNLTRLEELCIPDCFNQWQDEATDGERRNASLIELNSLPCLTTLKVHIPEGKSSPNNLCFENLVRFRISIGKSFLRDELNMSSTNFLKLSGVPLEDKFKVLLVKSEVLYLHDVKGLDDGEHLLGRQEQFLQTPQLASSRSFCKLSNLIVQSCGFNYLFHLSIVRRLQQLQVLEVVQCSNMEVIVENERQGDVEEIIFPRLKKMILMRLTKLKSFCPSKRPNTIAGASTSDSPQSLFCEKVAVPAIICPNINEIKIVCCPNLESIFSTSTIRNLAHLQYLTLGNKCSVFQWKAIVETSKERDGANNEPFVFPELNMMLLMGMVNLQGFCSSYGPEESLFNQKPTTLSNAANTCHCLFYQKNFGCDLRSGSLVNDLKHMSRQLGTSNVNYSAIRGHFLYYLFGLRAFFVECCHFSGEKGIQSWGCSSGRVVFPSMECMEISRLGNMKGIWNRTPPANSFQKLKCLQLNECHDLLYVGPSELLIGCLQNLEDLIIENCNLLEEVFKSRGSDSGEGIVSEHEQTSAAIDTNVMLPRLREVRLANLPCLKSFCSGSILPSSVEKEIINCPLLVTPF